MINSFNNYIKLGKVKRKTADPEESKALFEKAKNRIVYTKDKVVTEKTAQFVLEDSYEAIREAAQALMSLKGFKPYSHEATIAFIKEYYHEFKDDEIALFDRYRILRNDSVYKAVSVQIEDAKKSFLFAHDFVKKVTTILQKNK